MDLEKLIEKYNEFIKLYYDVLEFDNCIEKSIM